MDPSHKSGDTVAPTLLLAAGVVLLGLMAGVFFAFACSVMPGLSGSTDRTMVEGMQKINATIGMLAAEAGRSRPGMEAVVTRIADVIVIQAIREWIENDPAARFTDLVGEPVIRYLTRWRMLVALEALEAGETTVAAQADALGYRSEAAFSRAFKRVLGVTPGAARRRVDPVAALVA